MERVTEAEGRKRVPGWNSKRWSTTSPQGVPLLRYVGLTPKEAMREFGELVGKHAAANMPHLRLEQMLEELARISGRNTGLVAYPSRIVTL